ncbi:MAG: PH domain-containing protein [Lachnospiraceae bacterium]|uniref:PH domain-containing protein n=1 Tax=Parablautia sp. Marseille-Q6255 TaxID=3039593 RepID=UPI0024BC4BB4|nr:PH domain-containing protein [Parablautia sp. Marseille-Q6255]
MEYREKKRWLFFGLPFTFTTYVVKDEIITVQEGLLNRTENDCYMYKIVDVRLETSLAERIFGLGTVHCFSSDVTDPDLRIRHVKRAREIKDFILRQSEEERRRKRTLNTQNLDGDPELADADSCDEL